MWIQLLIVIVLSFNSANAYLPYQVDKREPIKIMGIFGPNEEEVATAFEIAVRRINKDFKALPPDIILEPIVQHVENYDSLHTAKLMCNATSEGIAAIFGPQSIENRNIIESMCQMFDIPHVEAFWDPNKYFIPTNGVHGVNVYPESHLISKGISVIINDMDWDTFTIIYETHDNLVYLQQVLENAHDDDKEIRPGRPSVTIRQLPPDTDDYRPLLKEIKNSSESHILLDCSMDKTVTILKQAKEVHLMGDYQNYILTNLNAHTVDFQDFQPGYANITTVRMINPTNPHIRSIMNGWIYEENERGRSLNVRAETVKIEAALMYDAVYLFAAALQSLGERKPLPTPLSCENPSSWQHGLGIGNLMKSITIDGMTGRINLDSQTGRRNSFSLEFVEYVSDQWKVLGTWNTAFGLNHSRTVEQMDKEKKEKIENRTLTVTSKTGEPYMMKNPETGELYGYSVDLIKMIANELNFTYKFVLERENTYGTLNPQTGKWNGLIGELQEQRADLAICDLTITSERRAAVDFTMPFMTLGISILYRKPAKKQPDLFSFLEPLSFDVWVYMATAYLGVSLLLFFLARVTPYEWNSHHPCNRDTDYLENSLTMTNLIWHNCGSLMQQGSDVAPQAVSTRLVAGMWWFFTLIMISSYTANLAAFLTNTRMNPPIKNVEDLAKAGRIKYGCVEMGSTRNFFKNSNVSLYQRMHSAMESSRPSVFVKSNKEGVERVVKEKGKYAFFMESTGIEYEVEKNCDLMQVGGLLDSKGYGIAMPTNSPHRSTVSGAVLRLQESGKLRDLKNKHWKEHNQTVKCEKDEDETDNPELGIDNVGGVFVVLIAGCGVSFLFSLLEFLWNVRKVAVEEKLSPYEAFMLELKFAIRCYGTSKPVRRKASTPSLKSNSLANLDLFNNKMNMINYNSTVI
ncbi:hypothetical protein M8J77_001892 [Diaphorina citri]|nr:hypothetical protein M8J77_001892 [Diaphorina citri]